MGSMMGMGDGSSGITKTPLPYQYGAANYALPPSVSQNALPPLPPMYSYQQQQQQQQPTMQMQVHTSMAPSNNNNNSMTASQYSYQMPYAPQSLPPPAPPLQQQHQSQLPPQQQQPRRNNSITETQNSSSSGSRTSLLPNVPKMGSPTRIQDLIQSDTRSTELESLKFPFLLPKGERSGRRGLFSLKAIMRPEDVEEIASSGQSTTQYSHESLLATDPIQAGVISIEDARTLFKLYMDEMSVLNSLLDPTIHTHDFVRNRSKFLYTAIMSVISRYLNSTTHTADGQPRRLISPVYAYCKQAARAHLKEVLGNVECNLEVIQGLAVLTFHKEPEDEKACLHLYRVSNLLLSVSVFSPAMRLHY
jgi:hypothetical protein